MLKPISTLFLAIEKTMLQIYSKVYQYALKNNFPCIYKAKFTLFAKNITTIFICFTPKFEAVQFLDKLNQLRSGPFKIVNKPTEVTYEILTQNGRTIHTQKKSFDSSYPTELLPFSPFQFYNEQNHKIIHVSDTTDMIQKVLYTLKNKSDFDGIFLMVTHTVMMMMMNQLCLITKYTKPQK